MPEVSFKRLFALNRKELPYLIVGCLVAGINGAVQPVFALLFAELINLYYQPPDGIFPQKLAVNS